MIVSNGPTLAELDVIARKLQYMRVIPGNAKNLDVGAVNFLLRPTKTDAYSFRLIKPKSVYYWANRYASRPYGDPRTNPDWSRKVNAICWHGHYFFMWEMFKHFPDAILNSRMADYDGRDEFLRIAPLTARTNVGNDVYKVMYAKCCICEPLNPIWEEPCA